MKSFIATAVVATMAAASSDIFLKEELLVRHLATGSKVEATTKRPNVGITTEAACTTLDGDTDSKYYEYAWNTDGCFCSHMWKADAPYSSYWSDCSRAPTGTILNPFHEINNTSDRCLTQAEYDACPEFDQCTVTPPSPPIEDCQTAFGHPGQEPTGYASVLIAHDNEGQEMYDGSGYESGWLTFQETCGMSMCGADYCIGTCVEGNIWGLMEDNPFGEATKFGIHINEFGVVGEGDEERYGVCEQTGTVYNPDGVAHGLPTDAIYPPGALGNIEITTFGIGGAGNGGEACMAQPFAYCAPPGEIKVADILGRSVVLRVSADTGAGSDPEVLIHACGTICKTIVNPLLDTRPSFATENPEMAMPAPGGGVSCFA